MKYLKRIIPQDLMGQLILLLLAALIVAQSVAFHVAHDERRIAQRTVFKSQILDRIAAASRLISDSPHELRPQILRALQTKDLRFWIAAEPALRKPGEDAESQSIQERLAGLIPEHKYEMRLRIQTERADDNPHYRMHPPPPSQRMHQRPSTYNFKKTPGKKNNRGAWRRCINARTGTFDINCLEQWRATQQGQSQNPFVIAATASLLLPDNLWLNAETSLDAPPLEWALPSLMTSALSAIFIAIVVIVMVRHITRPMTELKNAAGRLGRGEAVSDLLEKGPESFRATTRAFNLMNQRLHRFVNDRMRFLAAVSHDLRTPLTSLRLRSEFIDDEETRNRVNATIEEMNQMIDSILAFVREDTQNETSDHVDVTSLVESVCDDFSDLGRPVSFESSDIQLPLLSCRPLSIKRALRNLVDNAIKYGDAAHVSISHTDKSVNIHITDKGPGLDQMDIDRVFDPFVRLEGSRSRETGGVGLGLSIARTIAQSHGGGILAENLSEGGLRMTLHLPL